MNPNFTMTTRCDCSQGQRTRLRRKMTQGDDRLDTLRADRDHLLASLTVTEARLHDVERSLRIMVLEAGGGGASSRRASSGGAGVVLRPALAGRELVRLQQENATLNERISRAEKHLVTSAQQYEQEVVKSALLYERTNSINFLKFDDFRININQF